MGTKKLTAIWHIITSGYTLRGKMELYIRIQSFLEWLGNDLNDYATKKGKLHTLQALRAITEEQIDNGRQ